MTKDQAGSRGPRTQSRRALAKMLLGGGALCSGLGAVVFAAPAHAAPLPGYIVDILASHQKAQGLSAGFVERKRIAFLKAPLVSRGELYFKRPDKFARETTQPDKSKLVVSGDTVAFKEGNQATVQLSLKERPELRALVGGILLLFSGDQTLMEQKYLATASGDKSKWSLNLVPREKEMRALITHLSVHGNSGGLVGFDVHEASGDVSETELVSLRLGRSYTEAEEKRIFSL